MTDKTIRVGDLVMVVRGCCECGAPTGLGFTFVVEDIQPARAHPLRTCCGAWIDDRRPLAYGTRGDKQGFIDCARLKRIDPLSEPESIEHEEETHA